MGLYQEAKYQRQELWLKLEQVLANLYDATAKEKGHPVLERDNLFILLKIVTDRRMTNGRVWQLLHLDIDALMQGSTFDLKDLSLILDCYYKTGMNGDNEQHPKRIAEYMISQNFLPGDFLKDLSVNETLRLFRGLFLMEAIPVVGKPGQVYALYNEIVRNPSFQSKLNASTWLTVIETCRHSKDGFAPY
jgi:hypothetical protein